jgi:hypothetical protein
MWLRTSQVDDGIEGRYDDGEQQSKKPPEEGCMDKFLSPKMN